MLNALEKIFQQRHIENWLGDGDFRSSLHFVFEAADFLIEIRHTWVGAHGDNESSSAFAADDIAANVQSPIQVMHNIDQADGVHVEDSGSIGIIAQLGRVAGDAQDIPQAHRRRAQQIRLDAEHVTVAAGVMHDGFHPHLLLDEQRERLIAHARRGPRTIGDVDAINAHRL